MIDRNKTDPGLRRRGEKAKVGALRETTRFLGRHRRLFVPLGVLSLVALGVHAAADRFDDWIFRFLEESDRLLERLYFAFADTFFAQAEARKLAFASAFDLADKEVASRWAALGVELLIDLRVGMAALGSFEEERLGYVVPGSRWYHQVQAVFGRRWWAVRRTARHSGRYLRRLSVEKIYVPIAVTVAVLSGTLALFVALDNAFFALGRSLPADWKAGPLLSPWPAAVACAVVLWRLGLTAVLGSIARCESAMDKDYKAGESLLARTLRGAWGAALILPILGAGLWTGTPLGGWVRQILASGGP